MSTSLYTPRANSVSVEGATTAVGGGHALKRYWLIPCLLAVAFGAAGYTYARHKTALYTASAQLAVGTANVNTPQALGGFAASGPTLAAAYSRAVGADQVIGRLAAKLRMPPSEIRSEVDATVIPTTPVIRIDATGRSSRRAVILANSAADGLAAYAGRLNGGSSDSNALLARYRHAAEAVEEAVSQLRAAKADTASTSGMYSTSSMPSTGSVVSPTSGISATSDGSSGSAPVTESVAKARLAAAKLKRDSLAQAYRNSQQGLGAADPLHVLEKATGASSNYTSNLQLYTTAAAIAGLVLGWAIAILLGNRRLRRDTNLA